MLCENTNSLSPMASHFANIFINIIILAECSMLVISSGQNDFHHVRFTFNLLGSAFDVDSVDVVAVDVVAVSFVSLSLSLNHHQNRVYPAQILRSKCSSSNKSLRALGLLFDVFGIFF